MSEYFIIATHVMTVLEHDVVELLDQGWKCQGGICVTMIKELGIVYHQAMIKEGK